MIELMIAAQVGLFPEPAYFRVNKVHRSGVGSARLKSTSWISRYRSLFILSTQGHAPLFEAHKSRKFLGISILISPRT